ncbi:MAG TPA: hypothetical protein VFS08_06225, partial [Gemmatimonadaceae bacterium]|nr:hypothetical protein [Gemmatimonadaceae bacterium]
AEAARAQITTYKRHLMALVDPVAAGVSSRPDAWPCCICLRFAFEAAGMRCYWCRRRADDPTLTATLEEARARAATVAASGAGSTGLDWEAARAEAAAARAAARDPDRRGRRSTRHRSADAVSSPHAVHASDRHSHPTPYTAAERPEATSEDAHA